MAFAVHDPRALPLLGVLAPVQEDTRSYPLHEGQDSAEAAAAGDLGLDDGIESPQHLVTVHRSLQSKLWGFTFVVLRVVVSQATPMMTSPYARFRRAASSSDQSATPRSARLARS